MDKKGIALVMIFAAVLVLTILAGLLFSGSITEVFLTQRYTESSQAFWIAEAGLSCALKELRSDYFISQPALCSVCSANLGKGRYTVIKLEQDGLLRKVTASGSVPVGLIRQERIIESGIEDVFFGNVIYSAGLVDLNGTSYSALGNVRYAESIDNTGNVSGKIIKDPAISPLDNLNFAQLRSISLSQGNLYDRVRLLKVQQKKDSFPSSFWYTRGDDGLDNDDDGTTDESDEWVPNVNYIECDLNLNGNIGTIGGFFVVMGDVAINGNGKIDGAVYAQGTLEINGGGGELNIDGGVWVGEEAELNGNAHVVYNLGYMLAIKNLLGNIKVKIVFWRETKHPYKLIP